MRLYLCWARAYHDCDKHEKQFEDPIAKANTKGASFRTSLSGSMSSVAYRPLPYVGSVFTQYITWPSIFITYAGPGTFTVILHNEKFYLGTGVCTICNGVFTGLIRDV